MAGVSTALVSSTGEGFQEEEDEWDRTLAEINLNFSPEDLKPEEPSSQRIYKYKGVPIKFPYTAYKSQRQMMQKIIEGVTTGENCLLESPTGTGKTAALLCALLGWQQHCYNTNDNCKSIVEAAVAKLGGCSCGFIKGPNTKVTFKRKTTFGKLFLCATTIVDHHTPLTPATPRTPGGSDSCTTVGPSGTTAANSPSPFKIPSPSPSRNFTPVKMEPQSPPPTNASPVRSQRESSSCPGTPRKLDLLPSSTNFESPPKKLKGDQQDVQPVTSTNFQTSTEEERELDAVCAYCTRKYIFDPTRPPRIFYATRTHSQITQVIKQLKNSAYKEVKMTILGSREVTCIYEKLVEAVNPDNSSQNSQTSQAQSQDKNQKAEKVTMEDYCRTMVKNYYRREKIKANYEKNVGPWDDTDDTANPNRKPKPILPDPVCEFFRPPPVLGKDFESFQSRGAFDLEDLKTAGKECCGCPYYGSRALQSNADIVFLSYNYLIFPSIREVAKIRYINSVLVFDEAHNIEDICRDSFSFSIDVKKLDDNIRPLVDNLISNIDVSGNEANVSDATKTNLRNLSGILKGWSTWMKQNGLQIKSRSPNKEAEVHQPFESEKLLNALTEMQMTGRIVENCVEMIESINSDKDGDNEEYYTDGGGRTRPVRLGSSFVAFFKGLNQSLSYLFKEERDGIGGVQDFKGYLTRTHNPNPPEPKPQQQPLRRSRSRRVEAATPVAEKQPEDDYFFTFQIICLNPAIGFRVLRDSAFSIIVASGTLTPLSSFASELATKFAVTLQADHVIPNDNVWTGVVSVGPRSTPLKLIKIVQDDPEVQDEIGDIIVHVCNTVPNGILVFLPSYPLMTKLKQRWAQYPRSGNTILDQIGRKKMIFFEQSKNKAIFKRDMELYAEKVKGGYNFNGCILFAVFRGKVSEGIDFADEQARAVITVGIPYSNAGAVEVVSKKEYNDNRRKNRKPGENMLSGSEWYTIQAYRAMNQGFGRCVRHANDWGALILIDSRLGQRQNAPYISGWVKKGLRAYTEFAELKQKLLAFITERRRNGGRRQVTIEYEEEEEEEEDYNVLENTEIVPFPSSSAATQIIPSSSHNGSRYYHSNNASAITQRMNIPAAREEEIVPFPSSSAATQIIATSYNGRRYYHSNNGNAVTQRMNIPAACEEEVTQVVESSPEYSFTDETELILEEVATPMSISQHSTAPVSMNENSNNSSSISLFERTRDEDGGDSSGNESDLEMSRMADIMQSSANEGDNSSLNQSDIMDVSMPSERGTSDNEISQASSISYTSD